MFLGFWRWHGQCQRFGSLAGRLWLTEFGELSAWDQSAKPFSLATRQNGGGFCLPQTLTARWTMPRWRPGRGGALVTAEVRPGEPSLRAPGRVPWRQLGKWVPRHYDLNGGLPAQYQKFSDVACCASRGTIRLQPESVRQIRIPSRDQDACSIGVPLAGARRAVSGPWRSPL